MKLEISEASKKKTTKCKKSFICLENKENIYCRVEECINEDVLFIKCLHEDYCVYKMGFGNYFTCMCPVRKEIYTKYKI